jgi:hypothetical protein
MIAARIEKVLTWDRPDPAGRDPLAKDFPWLEVDDEALDQLDRTLGRAALTDLRKWLSEMSTLERRLLNAELNDSSDDPSSQSNDLTAARALAATREQQFKAFDRQVRALLLDVNKQALKLRAKEAEYTREYPVSSVPDPYAQARIRWELRMEDRIRDIDVARQRRLNPRYTAEEQQVVDLLVEVKKNPQNWGVVGDQLIPLTEGARRFAATLRRRVERMNQIAAMNFPERLREVIDRVLELDATGTSRLNAEVKKRLRALLEPRNLALMGGLTGGLVLVNLTGWGAPVTAAASLLTKLLFGVSVYQVTEDLAVGLVLTLAARRDQDFDKAADRLRTAIATIASDATVRAAMAAGVVSGRKALTALKEASATTVPRRASPRRPPVGDITKPAKYIRGKEDVTYKISDADKNVLNPILARREAARREWQLTQRGTREYGVARKRVNDASQELGERGAEILLGRLGPDFAGATRLPYRPSAKGDFDMVYKKGDVFIVVEAKGGNSPLRTITRDRQVIQQGSRPYFLETLKSMQGGRRSAESRNMAGQLEAALKAGKVRYIKAQTPINAEGGAPALKQFKFSEFDLAP